MKSIEQHEDFNLSAETQDQEQNREEHQPHRLNIPGFIKEEIGLGDVVKRVSSTIGIRPCSSCQRRAIALNRWLVFSPRRPK